MAVGAIGGVGSTGSHLQIQGAGQAHSQAPAQAGSKVDSDGDHDNSTPASDAAEGKGSLVNLTA